MAAHAWEGGGGVLKGFVEGLSYKGRGGGAARLGRR